MNIFTKLFGWLLTSKFPVRALGKEDKLAVDFFYALVQRESKGDMPFVFFKIPNDIYMSSKGGQLFGQKLKHMWKMAGVPDYMFVSPKYSFFIELKSEKGSLSEAKKVFKEWSEGKGVAVYVCKSVGHAMSVIDENREKIGGESNEA